MTLTAAITERDDAPKKPPFAFAVPRSEFTSDGKRVRPHPARTRGDANRRIIVDKTVDGVEYRYHATKGWRVKRIDPLPVQKAEPAP